MRVLWLSHFVPWPPAGMGMLQRSHNLLREAAQRDEVHLVALNDRRLLSGESLREAGRELRRICASAELVDRDGFGARRDRLLAYARTLVSGASYDVEWSRSRGLERRLSALAAGPAFDLVHLDTVGLAPHARYFPQTALVLTHHNVESTMMERRVSLEPVRWRRIVFERERRKLIRLERDACGRAHVNVVVSGGDAERLREAVGPVVTHVVPNGVDTGFFTPRRDFGHGGGGLVFAGPMDWYPNRDAMLFFVREIWPALLRDRSDRRAVILGRAAPAEVRGAADVRLQVPGFVDDVRPWIDDASIYVCPIRDGGGTRLKVLDALAMAKPVVATAVAVEGLELEPERHYLPAETVADWVRQIGRLERDGELRERLAREGRRLAEERYSWPAIGEALGAAYRAALSLAARDPARDAASWLGSPTHPGEGARGAG